MTYLRGLLLDGRRKSMQPMGERLGVDYQGLQQFVTSSTWEATAVRQRLAARAVQVIGPAAQVAQERAQRILRAGGPLPATRPPVR